MSRPVNDFEKMKLIADNLKRLMNEKGINQVELAEILKINKSSVNSWLLLKKTPTLDKIDKLADYFGVSPAEIISPQSESRTQSHLSKEAQEIIANLEQMNEMGQKKVLDFSCDMVKIYPR